MADTSGTKTSDKTAGGTGLFLATYECGTGKPGAPALRLRLAISAPSRTVTGSATLGWAVSPPIDQESAVNGTYIAIPLFAGGFRYVVTLTGYPEVDWPVDGGIGPVLPQNLRADLVLTDWNSGTASFSFPDANGAWHTIAGVPVRLVGPDTIDLTAEAPERVGLKPATVTATWVPGLLTITASGEEEGLTDIQVRESPMTIWPPQFTLSGVRTTAIGRFPYETTGRFRIGSPLDEIVLHYPGGSMTVPVEVIPDA
jgi:hypothetical protein